MPSGDRSPIVVTNGLSDRRIVVSMPWVLGVSLASSATDHLNLVSTVGDLMMSWTYQSSN